MMNARLLGRVGSRCHYQKEACIHSAFGAKWEVDMVRLNCCGVKQDGGS